MVAENLVSIQEYFDFHPIEFTNAPKEIKGNSIEQRNSFHSSFSSLKLKVYPLVFGT